MADVAEEYRSSLSELNFNSKPHINMLTMLAEENLAHAPVIVQAIVEHINSVKPDIQLPSLYLVDSIVKNIGKAYIALFSKHLVSLFTSVFEKVDENIRSLLYKLRSTWTGIFPNTVLLSLDQKVVLLDPAWPILAQPPHRIHVNPKFLDKPSPVQVPKETEPVPKYQNTSLQEVEMKKQQLLLLQALHQKKKELIQLQLKAATSAVDVSKTDLKKKTNSRDPRLSKKIAAASPDSESTVLQSVVVIPKGNGAKRNEKESIVTAAKKIKVDDSVTDLKKDLKVKPSSASTESESSAKLTTDSGSQSSSNKLPQATHSGDSKSKGKKRSLSSEHVDKFNVNVKSNKSHKWSVTNSEQKSKGNNKINYLSGKSDEHQNIKSHNHFPHNATDIEERNYPYKTHANRPKNEDVFSKSVQKMDPPPLPPLFLGNEDKDYRILPKNVEDRNTEESTHSKRNALPVVKSFILDKKERKIYFVNDRSFAFMDDNAPRELSFDGPPRLVLIEGLPQPIELRFGEEIKFHVDGKPNFIKFGTPSREVYINDYPYEAQFGGPPFTAKLSNDKIYTIHISGPAPQVILSEQPAYELYEKFCQRNQEFLRKFDSEPNTNDASSDVHIGTRDVDMRVKTVKFPSTFFNFPLEKMHDVNWQRVHVGNSQQTEWSVPKNSFETFKDDRPPFVPPVSHHEEPGWMKSGPLPDMQTAPLNPPPLPPKQIINRFPCMPPPPLPPCTSSFGPTYSEVKRPLLPTPTNVPYSHSSHSSMEFAPVRPELNPVIPRLSPPPLPPFMGPIPNTSCITSTHLVTTAAPYNNTNVSAPLQLPRPSGPLLNLPPLQSATRLAAPLPISNFAAANQMPQYSGPENVSNFIPAPVSTAAPSAKITNDMQFLMEKLKAAGLIKSDTTTSSTAPASNEAEEKTEEKEEPPKEETIPEITFDSKCLKEFHSGVISAIYSGSQCAICGMRFKEMRSKQYSRHLDWHFRRNRREKDGAKKPFSRRWFYEIKDWIQFKEFEDVDERAPSYFELQANVDQVEETPENIVSVSCSECDSENCAVCGEQFQLFWIEEEEEWHLRNAVKHDDQVYHPACYEDYKKSTERNSADLETSFDDSDMKADEDKYDPDIKIKDEPMDTSIKTEKEITEEKGNLKKLELKIKEEPSDLDLDRKNSKKELGNQKDEIKSKKESDDHTKEKTDKKHLNGQKDNPKLDKKESHVLKKVAFDDPIISSYKSKDKVKEKVRCDPLPIEHIIKKEPMEIEKIEAKAASIETVTKKDPVEKEKIEVQTVPIKAVSNEKLVESKKMVVQTVPTKAVSKKKPVESEKIVVQTLPTKSASKKEPVESEKMDVQLASSETNIKKKPVESKKMEAQRAPVETTVRKKPVEDEKMEIDTSAETVIEKKSPEKEQMEVQPASIEPAVRLNPVEKDPIATTEEMSKKEPIKEDEKSKVEVKSDKEMDSSKSEIESVVKSSDTTITDTNKTNEQSVSSSPSENVPMKAEEELEDVEFRPPTPDPRFEVLPPVFKGTEISNLCVIM